MAHGHLKEFPEEICPPAQKAADCAAPHNVGIEKLNDVPVQSGELKNENGGVAISPGLPEPQPGTPRAAQISLVAIGPVRHAPGLPMQLATVDCADRGVGATIVLMTGRMKGAEATPRARTDASNWRRVR
ncbi:hypothetical protein C2W62_20230 [Candidatus Entotheonella serta]|nr:hypothetical protein C2W62_20230 [Candidatus Entotheonella serta]